MNLENFFIEKMNPTCNLALLAQEQPDKCLDVAKLDRPIVITQEARSELPSMSAETRERLSEKWVSESILNAIGSEAEANIYESANLESAQINGKDALVRTDIDHNKTDVFGRTNLERMKQGLAPLDAADRPIELHHIGQKQDSPLAELTFNEHRGKGNDNVLHNKLKESEINRDEFGKERQDHWKARADQFESQ